MTISVWTVSWERLNMNYYEAQRKKLLMKVSDIENLESNKEYIECCEVMEWVERQISLYADKTRNQVRIDTYSDNLKGIDFDIIHPKEKEC